MAVTWPTSYGAFGAWLHGPPIGCWDFDQNKFYLRNFGEQILVDIICF